MNNMVLEKNYQPKWQHIHSYAIYCYLLIKKLCRWTILQPAKGL
jgi:hypothetical protein